MKNAKHRPKTCNETMMRDKFRIFMYLVFRRLKNLRISIFTQPSSECNCSAILRTVKFLSCSSLWSPRSCVNSFSPHLVRLQKRFRCSNFQGANKLESRSMVCPLCNNVTPLTTPSLPSIKRPTFPFFHYLRFYSSPTT